MTGMACSYLVTLVSKEVDRRPYQQLRRQYFRESTHCKARSSLKRFFCYTQKVDFQKLSESHDFPHHHPESWDAFISSYPKLPDTPVRIIELLHRP